MLTTKAEAKLIQEISLEIKGKGTQMTMIHSRREENGLKLNWEEKKKKQMGTVRERLDSCKAWNRSKLLTVQSSGWIPQLSSKRGLIVPEVLLLNPLWISRFEPVCLQGPEAVGSRMWYLSGDQSHHLQILLILRMECLCYLLTIRPLKTWKMLKDSALSWRKLHVD